MASGYSSSSSFNVVGMQDLSDISIPLPHPYLREPRLYISGLAPIVRKPDLAEFFANCVPYRPVISQDEQGNTLPGYIEFKELASAERALATLQNRSLPPPAPHCVVVLSPFPPTIPPTSLPPPSALPRLVKQLPSGITDSELYDLFRGFGPLANVRSEAGFGPDIGVVEFWREEDARVAEEAMHCADVGGQNISIQIYQPRKAPGNHDFSASAPVFVPTMYQTPQQQMQQQQQPYPHHLNVSQMSPHFPPHPSSRPPATTTHLFAIPPPVPPLPLSAFLSSPHMHSYSQPPHPPPHHINMIPPNAAPSNSTPPHTTTPFPSLLGPSQNPSSTLIQPMMPGPSMSYQQNPSTSNYQHPHTHPSQQHQQGNASHPMSPNRQPRGLPLPANRAGVGGVNGGGGIGSSRGGGMIGSGGHGRSSGMGGAHSFRSVFSAFGGPSPFSSFSSFSSFNPNNISNANATSTSSLPSSSLFVSSIFHFSSIRLAIVGIFGRPD